MTPFARGQAAGDGGLELLDEASRAYAEAKSLHVEAVTTTVVVSPMFSSTTRHEAKAWVTAGGRMRLESSNSLGSALVVSDGKKEWVLHRSFGEYTEQGAGAFAVQTRPSRGDESGENEAWALRNPVKTLPERLFSAHTLADETIERNGVATQCRVVHFTSSDLLNPSPEVQLDETIWMGKTSGLVLRMKLHEVMKIRVGNVVPAHAGERTVDTLEEFAVAEAGVEVPESVFRFEPPMGTKLVARFTETGTGTAAVSELGPIGTNALGSKPPALSLVGAAGERVTLDSFKGKPVLIDFWATWCGPCKVTMPALKKIRERTRGLGLAMVGVDSDEDEAKGPAFYRDRKFDWPDYHETGSVRRAFPHGGIPTTIVLDAEGRVVFFQTGVNEKKLVKAIAGLGPEYEAAMKGF